MIWMEGSRMWRLASIREPERRDGADGGERRDHLMERIFVPEEAFEAIKAALPMGSVACEPEITADLHLIWLERSGWRSRRALQ
jgi:hypothetical protein